MTGLRSTGLDPLQADTVFGYDERMTATGSVVPKRRYFCGRALEENFRDTTGASGRRFGHCRSSRL